MDRLQLGCGAGSGGMQRQAGRRWRVVGVHDPVHQEAAVAGPLGGAGAGRLQDRSACWGVSRCATAAADTA
jgi:hypothetical protein